MFLYYYQYATALNQKCVSWKRFLQGLGCDEARETYMIILNTQKGFVFLCKPCQQKPSIVFYPEGHDLNNRGRGRENYYIQNTFYQ